jgi:hypothetical protein
MVGGGAGGVELSHRVAAVKIASSGSLTWTFKSLTRHSEVCSFMARKKCSITWGRPMRRLADECEAIPLANRPRRCCTATDDTPGSRLRPAQAWRDGSAELDRAARQAASQPLAGRPTPENAKTQKPSGEHEQVRFQWPPLRVKLPGQSIKNEPGDRTLQCLAGLVLVNGAKPSAWTDRGAIPVAPRLHQSL